MTGFFGRKTVARSQAQRAVSKMMMTSALVAVGSLAFASATMAADYELPTGATVVGGAATFAGSGVNNENLTINQSTNRVIINWNTFNIGADASVEFKQLGADSLAVNRVSDDGQFSRINGRLTANGQVMILDPNGVIFGGGSMIDVGAIIASTGNVDDARVMAGDLALKLSNFGTGEIVNQGTINAADSGLVAFVAPTVKNSGVINANLGRVSLAAGNQTMTVDLYGDGLVELAADSLAGANSSFLSENTGMINAVGGKIQMTAATAKNVVDSVVNMQGVLRASSASVKSNGSIVLSAGKVVVGSKPVVSTDKFAAKAKLTGITGDTKINGQQLDLGLTIDGKVSGSVKTVNVLSDAAKIAQGLDAVATNGTVNVAAGKYNEHLVVDKVGVTLRGAVSLPADPTADRVVGETIVNPNSPGVTVTADNVTIDGFTFSGATGADGYGIFVNNADFVTLKNNTITDTSQSGIFVQNSNATTITNNNIGATGVAGNIKGDGIRLVRGNNAVITSNTISNVAPEETGYGSGIYAVLSSGVQIGGATADLGNKISNTAWDGVKLISSNNAVVKNNSTENVGRAAVSVASSNGVTVEKNTASNSGLWGVWAQDSTGLDILSNTITTVAGEHGVYIDGGKDVLIDGNTISGTKLTGIHAHDVLANDNGDLIISNNFIDNTGSHGVYVLSTEGAEVTRNVIGTLAGAGNIKGDGVRGVYTNGLTVHSNVISNTAPDAPAFGSGVYVNYSNNVDVTENIISHTKWDGVKVGFGDDYYVFNNEISDVARAGVSVNATTNSTVLNNRMIDMGKWGVWSVGNDGLNITSNKITNVTQFDGITSEEDRNSSFVGNVIIDAGRNGIYAHDSSNGLIIFSNGIERAGANGVLVEEANGYVSISNNSIGNSGQDGVRVYNYRPGTVYIPDETARAIDGPIKTGLNIFQNDISASKNDGIEVNSAFGEVNVTENTVRGSSYNGIRAQNIAGTVHVDKNDVAYSGSNGIYVIGYSPYIYSPSAVELPLAAGLFINENKVTESGNNGIDVRETSGYVEIYANQVTSSARDGIHVSDYNGNQGSYIPSFALRATDVVEMPLESALNIMGNKVSRSGDDGIEVVGSNGSINVSGNEVRSSRANGILVHGYSREIPSEGFGFMPYPPMFYDYMSLNVNKNLIVDSSNGISLDSVNGNINVLGNDIRNSNYNGVVARYVNQYGKVIIDGPMLLADGGDELPVPELPKTQLTISNNNIDNSGDNGIALYNVGGDVTIGGNYVTDSGYNGVIVRNYGFDIPDEETFAKFRPYPGNNPIQLRLVENTIENIGFVPAGGEVSEGSADKLFAEVIAEGNFPSDYKPQGFAAINLDISSQGTAEVSGNTLGNNFDYGLVAYSGTIDLTGAKNTIQNTKIGMGFYPTKGTPEADNSEYFAYLANKLKLVNNTIGSTDFINQSELFVDLGYGAFFAPDSPTVINGNDASYTVGGATISPSTNGGNVTSAEYDVLENFLNHYVDAQNRGLFFFNIVDPVDIEQNDVLRTISFAPPTDNSGSLTITGLPRVPGAPLPPAAPAGAGNAGTQLAAAGGFNPNAIEPAAGEEAGNTGDVADIQPAAGTADASSCWADATQSLGQGSAVTVNFGTAPSALLQDTANCGNGGAQAL